MPWTDSFPISYLRRSDRVPFSLERHGKTFRIGEGKPAFRVFDRIVSVGILPHVGRDNYSLYMKTAAFHVGHIDIHQLLMTKGVNNTLPMTRWY